MIKVTKTFLPPAGEYEAYLRRIWESAWVTNEGPFQTELEERLRAYLGVRHVIVVSNGTVALQLALRAVGAQREVITTPFSYVASVNAILWQGCRPVFCDIGPRDFCIDAGGIEARINENTDAILAVHVYGNPCDVDGIADVAKRHRLPVIYDGAHAFGSKYGGRALASYGDVTTLSFHATKVFHTIEGGAVVTGDDTIAQKVRLYSAFGHRAEDYFTVGINAKTSEFHAAMGLCNLRHLDEILVRRKQVAEAYAARLAARGLVRPVGREGTSHNHAYCPFVFRSEEEMLAVRRALQEQDILARRYFWPSLNTIPFIGGNACPRSEDISSRVLSLPTYFDLDLRDVHRIADIILGSLGGT
jgi:dTDP-4-amino-4,6-dideoxygalactose transaminase